MNFQGLVLRNPWLLFGVLLLAAVSLTQAQQTRQNSETTTQYSYDDVGQLARYEDETSRGAYTYDALGRLTAATVTYKSAPTAFSKTFSYRYDANGQVVGYTNPEAQTYDYRYTAHGQLAAVSLPGEGTLSYQDYAWLTPRSVLFPGGSAWELTYDGLLRQVLRTLKDPAGRTLLDYRYTYDAAGNLVTLGSPQGEIRYQYDTRDQLIEARYPSGDGRTAEAYAYDGVGNRLDQQTTASTLDPSRWRYNARNQLISRNGIGYRYDQDGHLIEQGVLQADGTLAQGAASPYWTYGYDSRGRLAEVRKNATLIATYRYDPLGRRLSKTLPDQGRTTFYLYNAQGLAAEYSASGDLIQEYGYDPTAAWMSQPLFTRAKRQDTQAWTVSYFGTSHLGTPEVAFDKRGTLTWQASAQAFGSTRVSRTLIDNPLRFPGQYWDAETGLHYNYFRDYDPQTGRYVQGDPIGLAGGINRYVYVASNPLNLFDLKGLAACTVLFPDYPVEYSEGRTSTWLGGHGGVLGYDSYGKTRYYEYGRYSPNGDGVLGAHLSQSDGNIRIVSVPNLKIDKDGLPTPESFERLRAELSRRAGKNTKAELSCDSNVSEQKVYKYVVDIANNFNRPRYSWKPWDENHCRTFSKNAFNAGR